MNELLESPPRLDGAPIGTMVSRVILAREDLIRQPAAPGPDFWRRIFALHEPSSATFNSTHSPHKAVFPSWSVSHRTEPPEAGSLLINCPSQDVFASLFGNPAINRHGEQYFRTGMISSQPEPVTICLVDPPDAQSRFWQHLSDILEQGYFIANGERVELPASLVLQQNHTPAATIRAFKQTADNTAVIPDKTCGVINTHNFDAIFSDLSAQGNTLQQTDTFHKIASEFGQLCITDATRPLTRLLHRIRTLPLSPDKSYPVLLVQAPSEFLTLLETQLHIEQRLDRAETLDSFHCRKALNKLLAHPVRGNTTIYSFVKAQISALFPDPMAGIGSDGIIAILNTMPALKHPQDLTDNFWPLARYMVPALADLLPATFGRPSARGLAKMATIIHSICPEEALEADHLPLQDGTDNHLHYHGPHHGHRLRLLYDALLVSGGNRHYQGIPVHQQAMVLNHQLTAITQYHPSEPTSQLQQHLQQRLQHWFTEPLLAEYGKLVSTDYELTPQDLKDIMARFKLIAADAPCPTSKKQVFALADEACRQSLGGRIHWDKRSEWQALRDYWCSSGQVDSQWLNQHQQAFKAFFSQLAAVNQK